MTEAIEILLTFDYELFQGKRSGSVANCMLRPTERIIEILKRNNAKAVFFIDMLYLYRLSEAAEKHEAARKDLSLIEEQLIAMSEAGHYVYNHLHPHWLDAVYDGEINEWRLEDDSKYAFPALGQEERTEAFDKTMKQLNGVLDGAGRRYKADGFRAGGLYIQPFSDFREHFDRHGIIYEFSVLPGAKGKLKNGSAAFDFSGIKEGIYRYDDEVTIRDDAGRYMQIALSIAEIPFTRKALNSVYYRLFHGRSASHRMYGDGLPTSNKISFPDTGRYRGIESFSIELLNPVKLSIYVAHAEGTGYLHILSHPKLVSELNLSVFDRLLQKLGQRNKVEYDFKRFRGVK